jgi:hypothetical protein
MNEARLNFPSISRTWLGGRCIGLLLPLAAAACGASQHEPESPKTADSARVETLQHEDCSESGNRVDVVDTNGDGKPDIRRVYDKGSGRELCRISDLNHDGKTDLYEYFDGSGAVRRREYCYDDTGVVNAVEHYQDGKLVQREYDAAGQHRIDTWDFFDPSVAPDPKTGRTHPARRERDTTGDGHIDQWWTWNGDRVTIAVDSSGDGKPDPESTIVLGADNSVVSTPSPTDTAAAPAQSVAGAPAPAPAATTAPAPGGK